jgi:hypothetical protein
MEYSVYNDMSEYNFHYEIISNLNCVVILLFFIGGVSMHMIKLSDELKVISESLVEVRILLILVFYFYDSFYFYVYSAIFSF